MAAYIPTPEGLNAEFYEKARGGVLHIQQFVASERFQHPPRYHCPADGSPDYRWVPVSGRGTLFSWTVTHHPFDRGWAAEVPYTTGIVELEEGVRLVGHVSVPERCDLRIGLALRAHLQPRSDAFVFLTFKPEEADDVAA